MDNRTQGLEQAIAQAKQAVARHESQNAGDPFRFDLTEHRYVALRDLLAALSSPPADDVREALVAVLDDSACWWYTGVHTTFSPSLGADAILAAFEVRPYGTVTDTAVEWEYGVRHVALDGWPTERAHTSLERARTDLDTCGMNCYLIRRACAREAGKWEPFEGEARS